MKKPPLLSLTVGVSRPNRNGTDLDKDDCKRPWTTCCVVLLVSGRESRPDTQTQSDLCHCKYYMSQLCPPLLSYKTLTCWQKWCLLEDGLSRVLLIKQINKVSEIIINSIIIIGRSDSPMGYLCIFDPSTPAEIFPSPSIMNKMQYGTISLSLSIICPHDKITKD